MDYRKLNSITIRDAFPLPHIDEALQAVHNCNVFTSFDSWTDFHAPKKSGLSGTHLYNLDCYSDSELDSESDEEEQYCYEHGYETLI